MYYLKIRQFAWIRVCIQIKGLNQIITSLLSNARTLYTGNGVYNGKPISSYPPLHSDGLGIWNSACLSIDISRNSFLLLFLYVCWIYVSATVSATDTSHDRLPPFSGKSRQMIYEEISTVYDVKCISHDSVILSKWKFIFVAQVLQDESTEGRQSKNQFG